jgi:hypothetical protein
MSPRASSESGSPALWFAVFGPPAAWFASLVVSYFAVHEVCRVSSPLGPRIASLVALLIAVAAGIAGRAIWLQEEAHERTRFLAQISVLGGGVFSLIVLLQLVATLLLPTCHERPRTSESPDVLLPGVSQSSLT